MPNCGSMSVCQLVFKSRETIKLHVDVCYLSLDTYLNRPRNVKATCVFNRTLISKFV